MKRERAGGWGRTGGEGQSRCIPVSTVNESLVALQSFPVPRCASNVYHSATTSNNHHEAYANNYWLMLKFAHTPPCVLVQILQI